MATDKRLVIATYLSKGDMYKLKEIAARHRTRNITLVTRLIQFSLTVSDETWKNILTRDLTASSTKATT